MMTVRDRPQARQDQEHQRIDDDGVGQREEPDGADAEHQGGHSDERVGGVEIAAEQEPGDHRAEPPTGEPPFVQQVEIAAPPARGEESHDGDEPEQHDKDGERRPLHGPPSRPLRGTRR